MQKSRLSITLKCKKRLIFFIFVFNVYVFFNECGRLSVRMGGCFCFIKDTEKVSFLFAQKY